ncbi:hypothetical protein [Microvirga alba]|uniref:Uncharacterized protein n=1 Tax=Microvirga alba TaxID=2791025 RepID=A0A931FQB5_9HYPH|nr:hypothetical protein [Microvirga alba]MBF9235685.1 hypothetical protein [Microvirga alba]
MRPQIEASGEPNGAASDAHRSALVPLSIAGLAKTWNSESRLYDRQLRKRKLDRTFGTENLTGSCICLIGVDRFQAVSQSLPADPRQTLDSAITLHRKRHYVGGFGLLVWANAVTGGVELADLERLADNSLDNMRNVVGMTTMETAWLLSGVLHELNQNWADRPERLARLVLRELHERFVPHAGMMMHAGADGRIKDRARRNIANFADQIYSLQAFAFAAIVLGSEAALKTAIHLAETIVARQGPLGQWWWHYNATRGTIAERYPVFSVHQHAMAPMALLTLQRAGGPNHRNAISRSYSWLNNNELGIDMVDPEAETIWRDIERDESSAVSLLRKAQHLLSPKHLPENDNSPSLKVNFETRPYEWAWCLYAAAIADSANKGRHLA